MLNLNPEKNVTGLSISPVRCSHLILGNPQKGHFHRFPTGKRRGCSCRQDCTFLPRDAMLASAVYASVLRPSVCPPVCLSQVCVLSKRTNESSWLFAWELSSSYPTLCFGEKSKIGYLPKQGHFSLELCPSLWT